MNPYPSPSSFRSDRGKGSERRGTAEKRTLPADIDNTHTHSAFTLFKTILDDEESLGLTITEQESLRPLRTTFSDTYYLVTEDTGDNPRSDANRKRMLTALDQLLAPINDVLDQERGSYNLRTAASLGEALKSACSDTQMNDETVKILLLAKYTNEAQSRMRNRAEHEIKERREEIESLWNVIPIMSVTAITMLLVHSGTRLAAQWSRSGVLTPTNELTHDVAAVPQTPTHQIVLGIHKDDGSIDEMLNWQGTLFTTESAPDDEQGSRENQPQGGAPGNEHD